MSRRGGCKKWPDDKENEELRLSVSCRARLLAQSRPKRVQQKATLAGDGEQIVSQEQKLYYHTPFSAIPRLGTAVRMQQEHTQFWRGRKTTP
jgi:hypothetical protein